MDVPSAAPGGLWDLARRLGALRWVERAMFEVAGGRGASIDDPAARVLLASHSMHHGWHADILRDRLPELRDLDVETLTEAPSTEWATAFEHLASESLTTDELLAAWFGGVVPAVVAAYEDLAASVDEVAAPSVRRWVRHLLLDEHDDLAAGRALAEERGADLIRPSWVPASLLDAAP